MGTIQWPLQLCDDGADKGYTNDTLQTALYETFSSVFDIIMGHQPHPIMNLFSSFMEQQRTEFRSTHSGRDPTTGDLHKAALGQPFSGPVLRGDASLADEFIVNLQCQIMKHSESAELANERAISGIHVSKILFHLVILRTYLSRPPDNDLDIFELVRDNCISRIWTTHEQALAACHGEDDTSATAKFDTQPSPSLWGVKVVQEDSSQLPPDLPLVAVQPPVVWTNRPGLIGGTRKPQCYRPPYLHKAPLGPRPKPKPAYGKFSEKPASDTKNSIRSSEDDSTMAPLQQIKRPITATPEVEMPATKRRATRESSTGHEMSTEQVSTPLNAVGPETHPKVRRGARTRNPTKF